MKLKLIHKLLIAMFACTALVLVLTTLVTRASIGQGFLDFLQQQERSQLQQLIPELADWYSDHGSWSVMASKPRQFYKLVLTVLPQGHDRPFDSGPGRPPPPPSGMQHGQRFPAARSGGQRAGLRGPRPDPRPGGRNALLQRIFLLDGTKSVIVGELPQAFNEDMLLPIEVNAANIGWLGVSPIVGIKLPEEEAFILQLRNNLLIGLWIGLAVAILLAWLLAGHLARPVNAVAEGIRNLASGHFRNRLNIRGSDEIARLGDDLNRLSTALGEHETARKRWMSDMAHELRTPLAIISGELEAMSDGVRPLDIHQLDSVRNEVKHLAKLIDDLHKLTLTDSGALAYKMQNVNLGDLVRLVVDSFQVLAEGKKLKLSCVIPKRPIRLLGDEQRLSQLLRNLLDNSVRYTDHNGWIAIELTTANQMAQLTISDSAPGASVEECEHLFERLYRVEESRNRSSGGSGLGLAICRNIVAAHDGQVTATPGEEGGLVITVLLPLKK